MEVKGLGKKSNNSIVYKVCYLVFIKNYFFYPYQEPGTGTISDLDMCSSSKQYTDKCTSKNKCKMLLRADLRTLNSVMGSGRIDES